MQCRVTRQFNRRGEPQLPGSIIDVPEAMLNQLAGYVMPVASADSYHQKPKAWLTAGGDLRTSGHVDDLAAEIVALTADNLAEQKRLLLLHCEAYDKNHLWHLWELWEERAAIMEHDAGLTREQAEQAAAEQYHLMAFLPELRCSQSN